MGDIAEGRPNDLVVTTGHSLLVNVPCVSWCYGSFFGPTGALTSSYIDRFNQSSTREPVRSKNRTSLVSSTQTAAALRPRVNNPKVILGSEQQLAVSIRITGTESLALTEVVLLTFVMVKSGSMIAEIVVPSAIV